MPAESSPNLEPYRPYLKVLAELHLDGRLRGKLEASDLVQQTMLRAHASLGDLRNGQPEALAAWLRRILATTLADAGRDQRRAKRDVRRERSLEAELDRSASGLAGLLAADQTSPSGQAERNEELLHLMTALGDLPPAQREVIVLKHCQGWTLKQIAERVGRTVPAVASLLRRGLEKLRGRLQNKG